MDSSMRKKIITLGILFTALCGCTVKSKSIAHTPLLERGRPKNIELNICTFEDVRKNNEFITTYYLYGIPMAKATSPPEFNQSITDAFKIELKHAGYKLEESGAARYKMMGKVITYSSKYGFFASNKAEIEISLYDRSVLLFKKVYRNKTSKFLGDDDRMSVGLQQILNELVEDINTHVVTRMDV
jgi:hypothetical protein